MDAQKRIKQLMEERGWTDYRLAKEANLSHSTITNVFKRNNAPTLPEVGEQLQLDRDTMTRALRELSLNHSIVKVERDVALSAAAEAHAREVVATAIEAAGGAATTSVLREALGVSRKRTVSILEHLDAVRFTVLDKEAGGLRSLR